MDEPKPCPKCGLDPESRAASCAGCVAAVWQAEVDIDEAAYKRAIAMLGHVATMLGNMFTPKRSSRELEEGAAAVQTVIREFLQNELGRQSDTPTGAQEPAEQRPEYVSADQVIDALQAQVDALRNVTEELLQRPGVLGNARGAGLCGFLRGHLLRAFHGKPPVNLSEAYRRTRPQPEEAHEPANA